jgi:hypothetical protein
MLLKIIIYAVWYTVCCRMIHFHTVSTMVGWYTFVHSPVWEAIHFLTISTMEGWHTFIQSPLWQDDTLSYNLHYGRMTYHHTIPTMAGWYTFIQSPLWKDDIPSYNLHYGRMIHFHTISTMEGWHTFIQSPLWQDDTISFNLHYWRMIHFHTVSTMKGWFRFTQSPLCQDDTPSYNLHCCCPIHLQTEHDLNSPLFSNLNIYPCQSPVLLYTFYMLMFITQAVWHTAYLKLALLKNTKPIFQRFYYWRLSSFSLHGHWTRGRGNSSWTFGMKADRFCVQNRPKHTLIKTVPTFKHP